ncbi:CoA transferase subunit A [Pseudomonas sp. BTN1]|uniref:CoA transferase subunit A n=1 Tax=Pseudomonas sp. BTN1 TaxID=1750647 RepID=UPI00093F4D88|nr:CoA-transferase [Pseudomonas sp. BTN1]OKO46028.1 3-oxoadipate--succinyl-CoA transferase subunit A [Pseudomonas sp. BTN1]
MAEILTLRDAVKRFVNDGDTVALEGFTHLIPTAAGHEIIRQGKKDLTLVRMTPDLIYDQLIGAGCARKLSSYWPKVNPLIKTVTCPFTGEVLAAVPSVRPDITVIHAQKADRKGNVLLWGILGVQKEAALAAKRCIVTVEEIVDDLNAPMNSCVLPTWALTAVCHVPGGAHPSYAHGYNERDNRFYQAWDPIARDRGTFTAWIDEYIHGTADFSEFQAKLAAAQEAK